MAQLLLCSVRVVMDRAAGIKRLESDATMELHMQKAVPLRPAVNRWWLVCSKPTSAPASCMSLTFLVLMGV